MISQDAETHEAVTLADLKPLAAASGPCLTALLTLSNQFDGEALVKAAVRGLEKKVAERGIDSGAARDLMAPILDLAADLEEARVWAHAVILFRSPGLFRYYLLHGRFQEMQTVGEQFQVRPLLQTLAHETRFHLLALSRHHTRLLHCTQHRCLPAETPATIPENLEVWTNNRQPDHVLESRSFAGRSVGGMKGVVSGTNADREREDDYLAHFFKAVDKGVTAHLHRDGGPLLLAGVEYELAIYRRENSYQPIFEKAVVGSPDGLPHGKLHERAMEVVMSTFTEPLRKAVSDVREYAGTSRSSSEPRKIVQASYEGRVQELLIAADADYRGCWNPETEEVDTEHPDEDLLNTAAVNTLRHGGRAYVLGKSDMPVKAPSIALFRF